jgi:hypothetical protein
MPATTGESAEVDRQPAGVRHVIPNGLVHVALVNFDDVPSRVLGAAQAASRRAEVDAGHEANHRDPGHERWFFHAFDTRELVFVIARWHPDARLGGKYIATEQIRVVRTPESEQTLGVRSEVRSYEHAIGGVRAGMSPADVEAVKGKPERALELGPVGSFRWMFSDICVLFLDFRVDQISDRQACTP